VAGDDGTLHVVEEDMTVLEADDVAANSGDGTTAAGRSQEEPQ
jgi:hypothetical protein